MRRTVLGLAGVAAACTAVVIACLVTGESLMERSRLFERTGSLTQADVDRGQSLARSGYVLVTTAAPFATGVLLAVVAILGLLAFRWELRRAER